MMNAESVRRELPFTVLRPASEFGLAEEGEISVQGMIDCCFSENGAYVLLDFKSDAVPESLLHQRAEQYRPQLTLYAEALEAITGCPVSQKILYFLRAGREISLS